MRDDIHEAVMVKEVINNLIFDKNGSYVDCTFGMGGHSAAILNSLDKQGNLTSIDKDSSCRKIAMKLTLQDKRMKFINDNFGNIEKYFKRDSLNGVLLDLGISSTQLKDASRGFSFSMSGPLDMRIDQTNSDTAEVWINNSSRAEIERVFRDLGEERQSKHIAKLICEKRKQKAITTTKELSDIIVSCKKRTSRIHPATNIFRAIRMQVNFELEELNKALNSISKLLKIGGRFAVISFHSLEDRIAKRFIQGKDMALRESVFQLVGGKPMRPTKTEIKMNPRSRSAILRIGERVS